MPGFRLSPEAARDLDDIWEYIAADSPDSADRVCEEISDALEQLVLMPRLGHQRKDLTERQVLFFNVRSYLIIYRPGTNPLEIVRVVHGARDVPSLL